MSSPEQVPTRAVAINNAGDDTDRVAPVLTAAAEARIVAALDRRHSPSTARNYRQDWEKFATWCAANGQQAMPAHPHTVADYLTEHADALTPQKKRAYSPATLTRWVASLNYWHRACEKPEPGRSEFVRNTLSGIRRMYADSDERPTKRVRPLLLEDLTTVLAASRADTGTWVKQVRERRDSALLLIGFAGGSRRSEVSALTMGDVTEHPRDGLHIRMRRSKTDQEGVGRVKGIQFGQSHLTCPVCAHRRWLVAVSAFDKGGRSRLIRALHDDDEFTEHVCGGAALKPANKHMPLFRAIRANGNLGVTALSGAAIHSVIRRAVASAGYPPEVVAEFGGHSLRAGFVSQALLNDSSPHAIMRQTGHASPATIEIYAREHNPLDNNAATNLGL